MAMRSGALGWRITCGRGSRRSQKVCHSLFPYVMLENDAVVAQGNLLFLFLKRRRDRTYQDGPAA